MAEHHLAFSAPPLIAPEPSTSCVMATEEASVAWSELPPTTSYTLERVIAAPDGCMELTLHSTAGLAHSWFLCLPRGTFPFEVGEEFLLNPLQLGEDFGTIEGVELTGVLNAKRLRVGRGQDFVSFNATTTLSVEGAEGCGFVHDDCGNLTASFFDCSIRNCSIHNCSIYN